MLAVKGIYDGKVAVPNQPVSITGQRQEVIITFLEPAHTQTIHTAKIDATAKDERIAIAKSLFGILPSSVSDDEIRAERLRRYESNT
jgi:hypothetical protein